MFVIFLTFAENRAQAGQFMDAHKAWIREGLDDGVFQLVGSLAGGAGGAILAHGGTHADIEARVARDPFVAERVVTAQIHEFTPSMASEPMQFVLG